LLKKAGDVFLVEAVVAKVGVSVSVSAAGGAAVVVEGLGRNRPLQIYRDSVYDIMRDNLNKE
jgi:hypothetical protein